MQEFSPTSPQQELNFSLFLAEALELIFMVAKHSNTAIAEMVSACHSWQCFANHGMVICWHSARFSHGLFAVQLRIEQNPAQNGAGFSWGG